MPDALDERLAKIEDTQSKIVDILGVLAKSTPKRETAESRKPVVFRKEEPDTEPDPVPSKYRKLVDKLLGKDFGLEMVDSSHGNIGMLITIPDHLDRRNAVNDSLTKHDVTKVILHGASALADLENWCQKIIVTIEKKIGKGNFIPNKSAKYYEEFTA